VEDSNVTGDNTTVTVDFDNEIFDQNADFAADTFTAPVTGRYLLCTTVRLSGMTSAADEGSVRLPSSNNTYISGHRFVNTMPENKDFVLSIIADMDANDTVTVTAVMLGEASKVVDVGAGSVTYFSGALLA